MSYKSLLARIGAVAVALAGFAVAAYAQDAAPAVADAAAAAAAAATKTDSGDTAWMLTSTALVLMMTIPGLALFYGGMVRKMNVLATMMQSFAITCLVTVLWAVVGYSLAFTDGNAWVGDLSRVMLGGMGYDKPFTLGTGDSAVAFTIPESVFMMFQMTFGIITPALIAGSFADRMKFSAMMWFMGLWSLLIYAPIAHWVWQPNGFLFSLGVLDFAGGTVVHINAGIAGLMTALVLGKRQGYGKLPMAPHNLTLTLIGASLLWVGWFGFNAGSAGAAGGRAGMAMTVTQIATAADALAWMFSEWLVKSKPSVLGIASGAVAGLVAITPASGFVLPGGAIAIGIAAGVICFFASTTVKNALGYDDSLDAFGVHCVGGIVGAILTGVFSAGVLSATDALPEGTPGLLEGNPGQVITQLIGIACTLVYSGVGSLILLKIIDAVIGLRVSEEEEREGLDQALHGEAVH
ncbi:MAG TPA: ammonium transporter [Alphaproteobacteria bacterium]|nr:ammonium transporter [Alphaproteobacteria bacterium]